MVKNSLYFFLLLIGVQLQAQPGWKLPTAQEPHFGKAVYRISSYARDLLFNNIRYKEAQPLLIRVSGAGNKAIRFTNTAYNKTTKKLETVADASETAVSFQ